MILSGYPELAGATILERRRYAREHHDALRTALMWEPRGHADMYGCVIVPPETEDADFGVLFLHNEGYSTMCGHGIIAVTTVVLETGMLPTTGPETEVRIDTPAGLVVARGHVEDGRVTRVTFTNVPSFVLLADQTVQVPGLGTVRYDVAFGGAFYAFVDAAEVGVTLGPESFQQLIDKGMAIKRAVMAAGGITHPFEEDLSFLYGTIFTGLAAAGRRRLPQRLRLRRGRGRPLADRHRGVGPRRHPPCARRARGRGGDGHREHHRQPLHGAGAEGHRVRTIPGGDPRGRGLGLDHRPPRVSDRPGRFAARWVHPPMSSKILFLVGCGRRSGAVDADGDCSGARGLYRPLER